MNRTLLSLATASILAMGCGRAALDQGPTTPASSPTSAAASETAHADEKAPAPAADEAKKAEADKAEAGKAEPGKAEAGDLAHAVAARMPGDFVVYRFSGSFHKKEMTLAERVVDRKGSVLTIDLLATQDGALDALRVRVDDASPTHEVLSVARLSHGVEKPASMDAYEALMSRTALAADSNEAQLGSEEVTVEVGGSALPAKKSTYRVRVGKREATLSTIESPAFAWGDVGGEIVTAKGKVLYRAEVIDAGHADASSQAAASAE